MKKLRIAALILALVLALTAFTACESLQARLGTKEYTQEEKTKYIFGQIYDFLHDKLATELTEEELDQAILAGGDAMLSQFDAYGFLLTPEDYYYLLYPESTLQTTKLFGFSYNQRIYLGLYVLDVTVDGMVYGILTPGDVIISIKNVDGSDITYDANGETKVLNVKTTPLETLTKVLLGLNELQIEFYHDGTYDNCFADGELRTALIYRGDVNNPNKNDNEFVQYYFSKEYSNVSDKTYDLRNLGSLDGTDVGYIYLSSFSEAYNGTTKITDSLTEMGEAMKLFKQAGKTKLILDLQSNPGGDVSQVVPIAGYFCHGDSKEILITTLSSRDKEEEYNVKSVYADFFDINSNEKQIVVITNENSASASELLLGAMLDYGTAVQIGTTSYGKGIAQTCKPILKATADINGVEKDSYYAIYYTFANYYTPKGNNIHGVGFTPDEGNVIRGYEEQIARALEILG